MRRFGCACVTSFVELSNLSTSGKTTLSLALMRMLEPSTGQILIDGLDSSRLSLYQLRSRIAVIPQVIRAEMRGLEPAMFASCLALQDPVLYGGDLRFNLDPFHTHTDVELWSVIEQVHTHRWSLFTSTRSSPRRCL